MKRLKVASALLSAVMCFSMIMAPVVADETEAPSETEITETEEEPAEEEETEPEEGEAQVPGDVDSQEAMDAIASGKCGKKLKWTLDKYGTLKITGKGAMYDFKLDSTSTSFIPSPIRPWNKYIQKIKKVVISNGVTTVGAYAFVCVPPLTSVSLPKSLKSINTGAFEYNAITSISIPKNVKTIGDDAFLACFDLENVSIPSGLTKIGKRAFGNTGIKSVVIPKGVKDIAPGAFTGCFNLSSIKIPEGVKTIGDDAFNACNSLTEINIPSSVRTIGNNAFAYCTNLETVNIPIAGLSTIGTEAFNYCTSLKSFKVPLSVTEIGGYAFKTCSSLKEVWMDSSLQNKYKNTSALSGFASVKVNGYPYVPVGYTGKIGDLEYRVSFPEINGNGTVFVISFNPDAEEIVIPSVIEFKGVKYKVNRIDPNSAVSENKNLKKLVIGANVTSIADNAFSNFSELVSVTGGANLKTIGIRAFENCPKLKVFNIASKSLSKIGAYAFKGDKALTTLQFKKTTKLTKSGVKTSLKGSSVKTVKVKKKKVKKYKKFFKKKNSGRSVKVKK